MEGIDCGTFDPEFWRRVYSISARLARMPLIVERPTTSAQRRKGARGG
jgi:hypothetical protein